MIAQIRGICMGGGLGLAAACDIRICADDARFRMPAGRLGLGYSQTGVHRFARAARRAEHLDIFFSARVFDAAEALRMGFVTPRRAGGRARCHRHALATAIAENAPLTDQADQGDGQRVAARPDRQAERPMRRRRSTAGNRSEDYREGVRAFAEKRKPAFTRR